jgi:DNA polymerase III delta prime subunit
MKTLGHEKNLAKFFELIDQGKLPQTMLFHGLHGIGKKKCTLDFVQRLLKCDEALINQNTHPDLFLITPSPPKSQQTKKTQTEPIVVKPNWTIKVEQVQALRQKLIHYPLMADHQIIIIDDAEKMTITTANSLLKILEEPRPQQIFILITSQLHQVLATIRSRCAKFYFSSLKSEDVTTILQEVADPKTLPESQTLAFLSRAFHGSVAGTLKALNTNFDWSQLPHFMKARGNFLAASPLCKTLASSDVDLHIFLQCLKQFCLEQPDIQNSMVFIDRIKAAEINLSRHIQKEFVLENLFL